MGVLCGQHSRQDVCASRLRALGAQKGTPPAEWPAAGRIGNSEARATVTRGLSDICVARLPVGKGETRGCSGDCSDCCRRNLWMSRDI